MSRLPFVRVIAAAALLAGLAATAAAEDRLARERDLLLSPDIQQALPGLGEDFEVLGPSTKDYNCVSYVLGERHAWINPMDGTRKNPLEGMDKILAHGGYRRLPTFDVNVVEDLQKVVVYGHVDADGNVEITMAALQEPDGTWTAKIGCMALIRFADFAQLEGEAFGAALSVYGR